MTDTLNLTRQQLAMAASDQWSSLLDAGASWSSLLAAGASLSSLLDKTPKVDQPYTHLLADIRAKARLHKQSTFGPESPTPEPNICNTPMCTAGHLVSMAGEDGWALKVKYGWKVAAFLIHEKAHPGWPCQNFGAIPNAWALAYIEEMAEREAAEARSEAV